MFRRDPHKPRWWERLLVMAAWAVAFLTLNELLDHRLHSLLLTWAVCVGAAFAAFWAVSLALGLRPAWGGGWRDPDINGRPPAPSDDSPPPPAPPGGP